MATKELANGLRRVGGEKRGVHTTVDNIIDLQVKLLPSVNCMTVSHSSSSDNDDNRYRFWVLSCYIVKSALSTLCNTARREGKHVL